MRVLTAPGTWREAEEELADVMQIDDYYVDFSRTSDVERYVRAIAERQGQLIDLLVTKGLVTLADCQAIGGPHMGPIQGAES